MWRHIASNALTLLVLLIFVAGGVIAWAKSQYTRPGPLASAICLRVDGGQKLADVAKNLSAEGAITSPALFRMGADYSGQGDGLKAGSFLLQDGVSMQEIVAIITGTGRSTCGTEVNFRIGVVSSQIVVSELNPETNRYEERASFDPTVEELPEGYTEARRESGARYRVTLAEGATSWQIVEALKAAEFLQGEIEEVPGEGTLAPESYEVTAGTERGEILTRMAEAQARILQELWQTRQADLPISTPEEALILASIIEKETGLPEERPQVASVFVNRLKQGMRLQTDPTVIYGVTRGQSVLGRGLRQSELRRETPWNTYVINGLPPTPIANPGRAAIAAALDPAATDFLFFVANGTGGHAFARTLAEHNKNVANWRRIEAERGEN